MDKNLDILQEIPENEITSHLATIAEELPRAVLPYEFIKTGVVRRKNDPTYDFSLYWFEQNKKSGIVVGILRTGYKSFGLLLYAKEDYENLLEQVLSRTQRIKWNESPIVEPILLRHYQVLKSVLNQKRISCQSYFEETIQYLAPVAASNLKIESKAEIDVARLTTEQVDAIYNHWSSKNFRTKDAIRVAIQQNVSYGLFAKDGGELLAWAVQNHLGAISSLFTKDEARGRGYAKLLIRFMVEEITKLSIQPFAVVNATNEISKSMFSSLGFECVADMRLVFVGDYPFLKNDGLAT